MTMNGPGLRLHMTGQKARILVFVTAAGRCPSSEFLKETPRHLRKRFTRAFGLLVRNGLSAATSVRQFKPLSNGGTGLWAWKEHDHRLFAFRGRNDGDRVQFVLLCGWVKDIDAGVSGSNEERNQIARALTLRDACYSLPDSVWRLSDDVGAGLSGPPPVEPVEPPVADSAICSEMPSQEDPMPEPVQMEKKPGDTLTLMDLSRLTGISDTTIGHWMRVSKKLPKPPMVGGRYAWKWEEVDAVVSKIHEIAASSPTVKAKVASYTGKPIDPEVAAPPCVPEIPEPVDPEAARESAAATAAVERFGVPTRLKLLKLAEEVIDGKRMVSEFTDAASLYRQEVERLEMELHRLRGE